MIIYMLKKSQIRVIICGWYKETGRKTPDGCFIINYKIAGLWSHYYLLISKLFQICWKLAVAILFFFRKTLLSHSLIPPLVIKLPQYVVSISFAPFYSPKWIKTHSKWPLQNGCKMGAVKADDWLWRPVACVSHTAVSSRRAIALAPRIAPNYS